MPTHIAPHVVQSGVCGVFPDNGESQLGSFVARAVHCSVLVKPCAASAVTNVD